MSDFQHLLTLFTRESAAVARLLEVLRAEEQALVQRRMDSIAQLTTGKQACLLQLEGIGRERERLLDLAGLSHDRAGIEALIGRADGDITKLQTLWERLRADIATCQEQNLKNGQILEANRRFAHEVLGILLGERGGTELYGRDGTASRNRGPVSYAKV